MQPGTTMTGALGLSLFDTSLDQGLNSNSSNDAGIMMYRGSQLNLGSGQNGGTGGIAIAPYQVSTTNNSTGIVSTGSTSDSSLGADMVALNVAGGQGVLTRTAPTPVSSVMQTSPVASASSSPLQLGALPSFKWTVTSQNNGSDNGDIGNLITQQWTSLAGGGAGVTVLSKDVVANNSLYVVGWQQDANNPTVTDGLIGKIALDGTTATFATQSFTQSDDGTVAHGLGIDVDANGNLLVCGYYTNLATGADNMVLESVAPDFSTINWGVTLPDMTINSRANGVKVSGSNVSISGVANNNLMAGTLDAATGQSGSIAAFQFQDSTGNPENSLGNGLGVDSTGKLDVAGRVTDNSGNDLPAGIQVASDLSSAQGWSINSNGPGGQMVASAVDSSDNAYYVGTSYQAGDQYSFLPVSKTAPDGQTQLYSNNGQNGIIVWRLVDGSGNHLFNWTAGGNLQDGAGDQIIESTSDQNTAGSFGQLLFNVGPTGSTSNDFGDGGIYGSNDDYGYGIAINVNDFNKLYTVGKTNSPDFATTNGVFQQNYTTGDKFEGWVAQITSP
jgi:hypothetical protein